MTLSSYSAREGAVASFTKRLLTHLKTGITTTAGLNLIADDPHIALVLPELKDALAKVKNDEEGAVTALFENPVFSVFYRQCISTLSRGGMPVDVESSLATLLSVYGFEKGIEIRDPKYDTATGLHS